MKIKRTLSFASIAALVALFSALVAVPAAVSAQTEGDTDTDTGTDITDFTDIQVTGSTSDGGSFEGSFSLDEFFSGRDGVLMAAGTLTGEVTYDGSTADENGRMTQQITEESVVIPVSSEGFGGEGVCGDISVTLGPAEINLSNQDGELPDNGTPPDEGTPPENGTPDDGMPDDGTTDDGVTDEGTRDGVTPDEILPEDGASDDGVTQIMQTEAGVVLQIDAMSFDIVIDDAFGGVVSDLFCNLSGLFGDQMDTDSLANLLNLFIKLS